MHMGQYAANNVHQHMLAECTGEKPTYMNLTPFPNVIGLALGKKCATYNAAEGTKDGEDLMDVMFGKDMANSSKHKLQPEMSHWLTNQFVGTICALATLLKHEAICLTISFISNFHVRQEALDSGTAT